MRRFSGFTLVELSIVLVIIGLIIGSVLVGKEMIDQARLRQFGAQIDSYKAATFTFRNKYNGLPGDLATAANFGIGTNGNGDGRITELVQYWGQLSGAQLVDAAYSGVATPSTGIYGNPVPYTIGLDVPRSRYYEFIGIYPLPANNTNGQMWSMRGNAYFLGNSVPGSFAYGMKSKSEAYMMDYKFDDGKPGMGNWQSVSNIGGGNGWCASTQNPATAIYPNDPNDATPRKCPLYVNTGF